MTSKIWIGPSHLGLQSRTATSDTSNKRRLIRSHHKRVPSEHVKAFPARSNETTRQKFKTGPEGDRFQHTRQLRAAPDNANPPPSCAEGMSQARRGLMLSPTMPGTQSRTQVLTSDYAKLPVLSIQVVISAEPQGFQLIAIRTITDGKWSPIAQTANFKNHSIVWTKHHLSLAFSPKIQDESKARLRTQNPPTKLRSRSKLPITPNPQR